jgi:NADPH:quinone reductase-like Zn-dependent oxidoreductase
VPNTSGADVIFQFPPLSQAGRYKISLWWPNVQNANAETQVQVIIDQTGSTRLANAVVDQRRNFGQWNDIGAPFIFTVPSSLISPSFLATTEVRVRIRRTSRQAGWILADAARILKVG